MTSNKKSIVERVSRYYVLVIIIAVTLVWFPVLFVSFINDDIQILSYLNFTSLSGIFQPFVKPDNIAYYWRPLGSSLHALILFAAGFHPFLFKLVSLLIYSFCIILFIKAGQKIGIEKQVGLIMAVIFVVLPSHELQVAWISDQNEAMFTIFILLAFISYFDLYAQSGNKRKNAVLSVIFFLSAVLTKEAAFSGIFIPFIVFVSQKDNIKIRIFQAIRDTGIGILIILLTLSYRYIFIGGTPFSSDHFSDFTALKSAVNFFIYIPLAFIPPEAMELLQSVSNNLIVLIFIIIIFLSLIVLLIIKAQKLNTKNLNILLTGLLWYVVFIIPAVPKLMRWYVFAASIGLFWILAAYVQNWKEFFISKKILVILIFLISGTAIYDFNLMTRWSNASKKFSTAVNSIEKYSSKIRTDSLLIWITPDKINRISLMKLGVQQSIQWKLKNDSIDVSAPFRAEMVDDDSHINLINQTDSSIVFRLINGRFLPLGGKSHYIIRNEKLKGEMNNMNYIIKTRIVNNIPTSILEVKCAKNRIPYEQLYFDGESFVEVK
ncbi:MAG: hypothetical protein WCE54_04305 [Ignavibacteriaceae bacterium]